MEENKYYYTPSIEEFHVGFRFEVLNNGVWDWQNMNASRLQEINFDDNLNNMSKYRVKYLDKEDIGSLGFEQQTLPYQFKKDWYRLIKRQKENQYIIEDGRYIDQIFVGTIKNKSELKKLLKQLNIN